MRRREGEEVPSPEVARHTAILTAWVIGFCVLGIALAVISCFMAANVIRCSDAARWAMIAVSIAVIIVAFAGGFMIYRRLLYLAGDRNRGRDCEKDFSDAAFGTDFKKSQTNTEPADAFSDTDAPEFPAAPEPVDGQNASLDDTQSKNPDSADLYNGKR